MANVQTEHGYTRVANGILEQMALTKLSPIQYRIIFVIWRYTYGFKRKEHAFSLSFFHQATQYDQRQLQRELSKLEERKIIFQNVKVGKARIIGFNKDFDQWLDEVPVGNSTNGKTTKGGIGNSTKGGIGNSTKGTIGNSTKEERKKEKSKEKSKERDDGQMKPNLFTEYEKNFGIIPPIFQNDVDYWLDNSSFEDPEQIIIEVINRAKEHKPRNPSKYINTMLKNLHEASLFTLVQVQDHYKQNDRKKDRKSVLDELREEWGVTNE
ncbi:replication protein [Fictibacillus sp. JL2B1089]|uniref:replication protein n=1 Tax=Fictibacillus sp. JL2B1089 TaxID=3399565 RepID=UPI003A8B6BFC